MKSGVVADAGLSWVFSPDAIVSKVQETANYGTKHAQQFLPV
jgi:hypothetical protein